MLQPRESDIPALFLVLVVLPLLVYVLLGKWSEVAKKREGISLLAQLAAEEGSKAEAMAVPDVVPVVSFPKNRPRVCARCFNPATTRCSRCKSVKYCSGKCQIIHWREVHKQECGQLETMSSCSSPEAVYVGGSIHESLSYSDGISSQYCGGNFEQNMVEPASSDDMAYSSGRTGFPGTVDSSVTDASEVSRIESRTADKWASRKSNREALRRKVSNASNSSEGVHGSSVMCSNSSSTFSSNESFVGHKSKVGNPSALEKSTLERHNVNIYGGYMDGQATSITPLNENFRYQRQHGNALEQRSRNGLSCSSNSSKSAASGEENGMGFVSNEGNLLKGESISIDGTLEPNFSELTALKVGAKAKRAPYSLPTNISKLPKSLMKETMETHCSEIEKGQVFEESRFPRSRDSSIQASNDVANTRMMKMMGLRKPSKLSRPDVQEVNGGRCIIKMLFPYEDFVKFFSCVMLELSPRGLLNCGNSCYANAVLQCLTCTKPLTIYLLHRSHSRSCCGKDWCLMCELEQHVMLLREIGGPLSPSRILSHVRSINCNIGDGSQEDAHEFLRLLVASMQSICLEGLGGENKVDPILQETTFIQHTFAGNIRSKVKCLRCHHESERYENIMDLTLEIFGWVESLEDALTQFTTPEDLDGENMYRCGRCAAYVRARKQLSIHEAPNILTIVLKRFQEGRYGKINKCIAFPDMLDMIPFMTGMGDIPPLYILYAVVVHLDTLNASFSGHYVSYVKDLKGNWFRIDDADVQQVSLSQVMSEGAYMLFYMRSSPRPQRALSVRGTQHEVPNSTSYCAPRAQKPSRPVQKKSSSEFVGPEPYTDDPRHETANGFVNYTSNGTLSRANKNVASAGGSYTEPINMEFSDATSSDWSLFTSSDEASFTTDSARDSFSTVDYADASNIDPISSIFHTVHVPEYSQNSLHRTKVPNSRLHSRFVCQRGRDQILDSYLPTQPHEKLSKGYFSQQVSGSPTEISSDSNCGMFVRYGSNKIHGYGPCKL